MSAPLVTVVGEALVDVVRRPDGATARHPGGSPANVAVGLARLGTPVTLVTRFGPDEDGELVRGHLEGNGVPLAGEAGTLPATSVAEATLDEAGVASYDFRIDWTLDEATQGTLPEGTACLHTGSIATVLAPGAGTVRSLVEQARGVATVSYDPNCRPSLMGDVSSARDVVEGLVAASDVVKVSDEDLAWLYPGEDYRDRARTWLALGPAVVVVTRGADGPWAALAGGEVDRPPVRVEVADTVGAGDSFMGGLLDGLARRGLLGAEQRGALAAMTVDTLADLLDRASVVAAITCSRPGADPPTAAEVDAWPSSAAR